MTDDQQAKRTAQAEENKALFVFRVIRVVDQFGTLVDEDRFGFFESDAMLARVCGSLPIVSLEAKCAHARSVTTL